MDNLTKHTQTTIGIDWKSRALAAEAALAEKVAKVEYLEAQLRLHTAKQ